MSKINGYEKKIDEIELDFEMHRKKIEDLSNNKALNLLEYNSELENCVKLIREDKEKIIKIIEEIKKLIDQNNEQKKDKILDIAGSVVKVGIGIIGGFSVKGVSRLINFGGAIMNGGSAILDALTINKLNENSVTPMFDIISKFVSIKVLENEEELKKARHGGKLSLKLFPERLETFCIADDKKHAIAIYKYSELGYYECARGLDNENY